MIMLDLFSGIGGFKLACDWVWGKESNCVGFVEIDKFCQKVLKKHWPDVPIYDDVKTFKYDGKADLITGGFPCQDISIAGKGVGIEGNRSGLWSEFKRIISEVRPQFALIENVPALTFRGLDRVLCDLAEIGYDAEWQCISAAEVGAWHKRERIWILSYPKHNTNRANFRPSAEKERLQSIDRTTGCTGMPCGTSDKIPDSERNTEGTTFGPKINEGRSNHKPYNGYGMGDEFGNSSEIISNTTNKRLERQVSENKFSRGQQGLLAECDWWAVEPELGRVAHGIPNRVDRLKSIGKAIVPQVAFIIMQKIKIVMESE